MSEQEILIIHIDILQFCFSGSRITLFDGLKSKLDNGWVIKTMTPIVYVGKTLAVVCVIERK